MPGLIPEATGQPGGAGIENPFGMMNSLMDFQNKANANRKFQAEFMANQALGEIMAHASSPEEGVKAAMANPLIAGFGQEGLTSARNYIMLGAQTSRIQQETAAGRQAMSNSGYDAAIQSSTEAMNDPLNYNKYFDAGLKGVDPSVLPSVKARVDAVRQAIGAKIQGFNLSDPTQLEQAKNAVKAAFIGAYAGANGDPGRIAPMMPRTEVTPQGIPMHVPSQVEQMGGGPTAVPSVISLPQPGGGAPSAGGGPTGYSVTNSGSGETYPVDVSGIHSYLVKDTKGNPAVSVQGRNAIDDRYTKMDENLKEQHSVGELAGYNGDKGMINSLAQMQSSADDLTARGGFTVPGLFGTARAAISNAMETAENVLGTKFTGDAALPVKDAETQVINKWAHALPFQIRKALDAQGKPGLGVLMEAAAAVPSLENTPLAFKVLTTGLKALAYWDMGKYDYKEAYLRHPGNSAGTLLGSDEAYGKVASPLTEATKELEKIGIKLDGSEIKFTDTDHLLRAYETGLFGARKNSPNDPDGPAEKAMDDMYDKSGFNKPKP